MQTKVTFTLLPAASFRHDRTFAGRGTRSSVIWHPAAQEGSASCLVNSSVLKHVSTQRFFSLKLHYTIFFLSLKPLINGHHDCE